jgi:hypothetical protein
MIGHLIKKDLRKTWTMAAAFLGFTILLCAVILPEYSAIGDGFGGSSGMMLGGLMLYMLVFGNTMNIEKYEEKHHAYSWMAQLPVSGHELVLGKYIIVLVSTVAGVAVLQVLYQVFSIISAFPYSRLAFFVFSGCACLVLNGVAYLGLFRFGYRKMRAAIMALYVLCLIGPQLLLFLRAVGGDEAELAGGLASMSPAVLVVAAFLSLVVFAATAYAAAKSASRPAA